MTGLPAGAAGTASLPSAGDVPAHGTEALTLAETARLVSAWGWAEGRFYEVVGGWVASTRAPAAKIYFDACSQHHAWRARLWEERRPGLPSHFVPGYDGNGPAIDGLTTLDDDVGRLSAYCRVVLPRLVVGYRSWQGRGSAPSDQPVARALGFALADVVTDWERGSGLLQGHLDGDGDGQAAASAADAVRDLDRLLALKGLWPSR
jgi:hypothetical protein